LESRALVLLFAASLCINLEGERILRLDDACPYPGAEWVTRLKYSLGLEIVWSMYAPQPPAAGGWGVGVALTQDGREIDPITGVQPSLARPSGTRRPFAGLEGYYWTDTPSPDSLAQERYARYLLWKNKEREPLLGRALTHLTLIYVYEPFLPLQVALHQSYPLLVYQWPPNDTLRTPLPPDSFLRRIQLYQIDYDRFEEETWQPEPLSPPITY
jgi:hypothetical protein